MLLACISIGTLYAQITESDHDRKTRLQIYMRWDPDSFNSSLCPRYCSYKRSVRLNELQWTCQHTVMPCRLVGVTRFRRTTHRLHLQACYFYTEHRGDTFLSNVANHLQHNIASQSQPVRPQSNPSPRENLKPNNVSTRNSLHTKPCIPILLYFHCFQSSNGLDNQGSIPITGIYFSLSHRLQTSSDALPDS
jgi:hypothetical protein